MLNVKYEKQFRKLFTTIKVGGTTVCHFTTSLSILPESKHLIDIYWLN